MVEYLQDENAYGEAVMAPTAALQEELFQRIRARVSETDVSAPSYELGWWYWSRSVAGQQYPVHCRRPDPNRSLTRGRGPGRRPGRSARCWGSWGWDTTAGYRAGPGRHRRRSWAGRPGRKRPGRQV